MAPTGLMMSWQMRLEISAASSRSVGVARWLITCPLFEKPLRRRVAAAQARQRDASQCRQLAKMLYALIHAPDRNCQVPQPVGRRRPDFHRRLSLVRHGLAAVHNKHWPPATALAEYRFEPEYLLAPCCRSTPRIMTP